MDLLNVNASLTFALALLVTGSSLCRMVQIEMGRVQYRFAAPFVLFFFWGLATVFSTADGARPSWYQPLGMLAVAMYLWNTKGDWKSGLPWFYTRDPFVVAASSKKRALRKILLQNASILAVVIAALVISAAGSVAERSAPLEVHAAVVNPSSVKPGGVISVQHRMTQIRPCPGYITQFLVDARTGTLAADLPQIPLAANNLNVEATSKPVNIELRPDIPAGRYLYRAVISSSCPDGAYVETIPDAPVVVLPN